MSGLGSGSRERAYRQNVQCSSYNKVLQGDNFPKDKATKHNNDPRVQPLILTDNKQRKLSFHKADQQGQHCEVLAWNISFSL